MSACLCLILAHAVASAGKVRGEFLHAIQVLERGFKVEIAEGVLSCLKVSQQWLAKRLAESASAPPLIDPEILLADRTIPFERRSAVAASS